MSVVTCESGHPLYEQFARNPQKIKYLGLDIQVESGPWFATKWKQKALAFAADFCSQFHDKFCFLVERHGAICIWLENKKAEFNQSKLGNARSLNKHLPITKARLTSNNKKLATSNFFEDYVFDEEFAQLWMQLEALADSSPALRVASYGSLETEGSKNLPRKKKQSKVLPKNAVLGSRVPEIQFGTKSPGLAY